MSPALCLPARCLFRGAWYTDTWQTVYKYLLTNRLGRFFLLSPTPYFLSKGHHTIPLDPTSAPSSPTSQPSCHLPRGPGFHGLHAELRSQRPAPAGISAPRRSPESAGLGQGGAAAYLGPRGHPGEALDCHWPPPTAFLLPCPFGVLGLWQLRHQAPGLTPRGCDSGSPELAGDSSRNWPHQEDPCEFDVSRIPG